MGFSHVGGTATQAGSLCLFVSRFCWFSLAFGCWGGGNSAGGSAGTDGHF